MLVCIGSQALTYQKLSNRSPEDLDLIGTYDEISSYCKIRGKIVSFYPIDNGKKILSVVKPTPESNLCIESEIAWRNSSAENLVNLVSNDFGTKMIGKLLVPNIHVLYMLKMSHRYLRNSPHFLKTMSDIHYLRSLGAEIKSHYQAFYRQRVKETYNYSHPKLNVKKNDFFAGDGVEYVYDHDSIHEVVKHLEFPAYSYFKKIGEEVACSKEKFLSLTEEIKLYAVLEEAYVLALERSQIPFRGKVEPRKSFEKALEKICTSITSGWFREYAWENYHQVLELFDETYSEKFFSLADKGAVKLWK